MAHTPCTVLVLIAFLAVLNVGQSSPETENFVSSDGNDEIAAVKRPAFHVGSRYGRSPLYSQKSRRVNVVPRNDRFFLGSRYGKRSNEYVPVVRDDESQPNPFTMSCTYTGLKDYYRCTEINEINNFIQKLSSEENSSAV